MLLLRDEISYSFVNYKTLEFKKGIRISYLVDTNLNKKILEYILGNYKLEGAKIIKINPKKIKKPLILETRYYTNEDKKEIDLKDLLVVDLVYFNKYDPKNFHNVSKIVKSIDISNNKKRKLFLMRYYDKKDIYNFIDKSINYIDTLEENNNCLKSGRKNLNNCLESHDFIVYLYNKTLK